MMKSAMILPCGVSSAAKHGLPGATLAISPVTRPLRKRRASSPTTLTTPRSERSAACMPVLKGSVSIVSCQNSRRNVSAVGQASSPLPRQLMADTYDLILKGGTVVNHDGESVRDLGIRGSRFQAIGDLSRASAGEVIDCRGLHLLPGVIDTQVHFREPGLTHKEDLESGSLSAVMGGVTAVFEMPNTDPLTVNAEALADKVKRGHHRMHCDFAFFVGATVDNTKHLAELERLPGCAGVKVFMGSSTGSLLVAD